MYLELQKRDTKYLSKSWHQQKGLKGGWGWIKLSKKDMAVTFSYCECTWRLMLHAWPLIAQWLGILGTRADKSVQDMCWLLCHLYSTWKNDGAIHHCQRVVANFGTHIAPTSASHYLFFFEFVCPTSLPQGDKFGFGIFCQDGAESLNHLLKSISLTMTNRAGSTQVDTTLPPGVADRFHRESLAMKQTLQYIFLYFFVPIIARNETRWAQCTNQKIVDAVYVWFDADNSESEDEVDE